MLATRGNSFIETIVFCIYVLDCVQSVYKNVYAVELYMQCKFDNIAGNIHRMANKEELDAAKRVAITRCDRVNAHYH